eukprot:1158049-Pelagomonas_calceolata.AAC.10
MSHTLHPGQVPTFWQSPGHRGNKRIAPSVKGAGGAGDTAAGCPKHGRPEGTLCPGDWHTLVTWGGSMYSKGSTSYVSYLSHKAPGKPPVGTNFKLHWYASMCMTARFCANIRIKLGVISQAPLKPSQFTCRSGYFAAWVMHFYTLMWDLHVFICDRLLPRPCCARSAMRNGWAYWLEVAGAKRVCAPAESHAVQ